MANEHVSERAMTESRAELRWYFRWAGADCGFRAQAYGGSGGGGGNPEADRTTDKQVEAYGKQRRVRAGLAQVDGDTLAILRLAFEGHGRDTAILVALGDVAELVYAAEVTRTLHAGSEDRAQAQAKREGRKRGRRSFGEWLASACRDGLPGLDRIREAQDLMLAEAVAAYARVRVRPGRAEATEEQHEARRAAAREGAAARQRRCELAIDAAIVERQSGGER